MSHLGPQRWPTRVAAVSTVATMSIALPILILRADGTQLTSAFEPRGAMMSPLTALALCLLALSLSALSFRGDAIRTDGRKSRPRLPSIAPAVARGGSVIAAVIGIVRLCDHLFGWNL